MNNLKLQKVDQESGGERNSKADDAPSVNTVLHHILRITSDKKLSSEPLQNEKAATDSKPLTPNGDVLDAESICEQVKIELVKYNVSQEVFAKAVLGKSQGYLSEMLKHGESFFRPHDSSHYKGWLNFETMRRFLLKPEEERLGIYHSKGEELKMERLKRRQIEIVSCILMIIKKCLKVGLEAGMLVLIWFYSYTFFSSLRNLVHMYVLFQNQIHVHCTLFSVMAGCITEFTGADLGGGCRGCACLTRICRNGACVLRVRRLLISALHCSLAYEK